MDIAQAVVNDYFVDLGADISFVTDEVGHGHYGELWKFAKRRKVRQRQREKNTPKPPSSLANLSRGALLCSILHAPHDVLYGVPMLIGR